VPKRLLASSSCSNELIKRLQLVTTGGIKLRAGTQLSDKSACAALPRFSDTAGNPLRLSATRMPMHTGQRQQSASALGRRGGGGPPAGSSSRFFSGRGLASEESAEHHRTLTLILMWLPSSCFAAPSVPDASQALRQHPPTTGIRPSHDTAAHPPPGPAGARVFRPGHGVHVPGARGWVLRPGGAH